MATELAMAMRKLKAQEALVQQMADLNRKMDLVMAKLGIEEAPTAATSEAKADEAPADVVEPSAEEIPAVEIPAVETKPKKK